MSFRTAREVIEAFAEQFGEALRWCEAIAGEGQGAMHDAAELVREELKTRAIRFRAALETADENALATYLQNDPIEDLREAVGELTESQPEDPDALFAEVATLYQKVGDQLTSCVRVSESTPAAAAFSELLAELEVAISSRAWMMRDE